MTRRTRAVIATGVAVFVLFYIGLGLVAGDETIVGLGWQLGIMAGVAGLFSFFMWRNLRRG